MKFFSKIKDIREEYATGEHKPKGHFQDFMNGEILVSDKMRHHLPYICFCFFLAMAYINNSYTYEQNIRERQQLVKVATDMKYRCVDVHTQLTSKGQRTQLLQDLEALGSTVGNAQTQPILLKK
ncbi:MAG: hypothetical protein MJZ96_00425 [Paludibacteraceae bacterium]|nr:hypothetical protein [Paludibacteraceae bacterium]